MGHEASFSYFQNASSLVVCIVIVLFMANVALKLFSCPSWLSLLISFLTTFCVLGIVGDIDETTDIGAKPLMGYYMLWTSFIGLLVCLFISWTLFLGKKIVNYKRWLIISGSLVAVSLIGFILSAVAESFASIDIFSQLLLVGIILLPGAVCSYVLHRKEKNTEACVKPNSSMSSVMGNLSKAFQKLPRKKEMAAGALLIIAIVVGISMCGGGDDSNVEAQLPNWKKFVKVKTGDVNLRKAPDADSPKLMEQQNEMDSELVWSDAPENEYGSSRSPYHLRAGQVCPVVSETSEWYEISIPHLGTKAYMLKKFGQEVTPEPVKDMDYPYYNIREIFGDEDVSWFVLSHIGYDSGEREVFMKLGFKKDNAYIFNKSIIVSDDEKPYELYVHPHFGDNRLSLPQSCFDNDGVILDKFTDTQLFNWLVFGTEKGFYNEIKEAYYCFEGQIYKF